MTRRDTQQDAAGLKKLADKMAVKCRRKGHATASAAWKQLGLSLQVVEGLGFPGLENNEATK